jgi:hypothetical protein
VHWTAVSFVSPYAHTRTRRPLMLAASTQGRHAERYDSEGSLSGARGAAH